ncbi:MAG: ribosomal RNA small subunit methyltransferase A, partial [Armatimonadota bacterium]
DFLELDIAAVCGGDAATPWKIVANLPYRVTTPILHRVREHSARFERSIVTVQAEVADRLRARPGSRTYGAMTVAMQAHFVMEPVRTVPPQAFFPEPDVVSQVICLQPHAEPVVPGINWGVFEQVVRGAFAQRRKTILNSLAGSGRLSAGPEEIADSLRAAGIDAGRRAETVSLEEFGALTRALARTNNGDARTERG